MLEYHIEKKADITVVVKELPAGEDANRFGVVRMNQDMRITDFEEKPIEAEGNIVSTGIYIIRRRQLIELLEKAASEDRYDFVKDILIRYKNIKRVYGYKLDSYWNNISTVDAYYKTNMDFLKRDVREFFFNQYPDICSKVDDLPPAKYNPGSEVKNSLVASGCIINGTVENSVLFKKVFVGNNCVIRNSIILNDVYIGDNTVIENCIVESRDTIRSNCRYAGEDGKVKVVVERTKDTAYKATSWCRHIWRVDMQVTDVRVRMVSKDSKMKAVVSVTFDNEFVVHDIKVIEGEKGLFIAMPSKKSAEGEYRDIAHPISSATRDMISNAILEAYDKAVAEESI